MYMNSTLIIYLTVYVVILIGISWFISRGEQKEDFLIANRDRKWWVISASKFAGAIGVGYFIVYTGYAYEYGLSVYAVVLGSLIGYTLFAFWASPRIYANSREQNFYTQGDFVFHSTKSSVTKLLTNTLSIIIIFAWLLISVVGGAKIISHFGLMSYEFALLATTLVVMFYILLAGFKAVLVTDIIQSVIIFVLIGLLAVIMTSGASFSEIFTADTGSMDIATAVGFLLFGILSVFSFSNWYQLCYAAKDKRALRTGIATAIIPITVVASFLLMIGMFMYLNDTTLDSGLVFIEALKLYLPQSLIPIGIVMFFAGLMSSADTNVYAITSHYVLSKNTQRPVHDIRVATVVLSVLVMIIAYFYRDIVDITIIAAAISLVLSIPMIYIIFGGKSQYRFIASITGAIIGLLVGFSILGIEPTIALPVLVGGLLGLIYNGWFLQKRVLVTPLNQIT